MAPAQRRTPRTWELIVRWAVVVAALVVVAVVAVASWTEWAALLAAARPGLLLLALAAGVVGQYLNVIIAHESLRVTGTPVPLRAVYRMIAVGGLAKFIPGGVWQVGSQYGLGKAEGLGFRSSMLAWIEPTAFNITIGSAFALLAATTVDYGIPPILLIVGALAALAVSTNPIRHWIYRLVRLAPPGSAQPGRMDGWPFRAGVAAAIIGLTGVGGMLVVGAFGIEPSPGFLGSVAAFVGAWAVGVLVFPVPGGLGIREGALVLALAPWMPAHEAVLIAASSRLVAVAAELLAALVGVVIAPGSGLSPAAATQDPNTSLGGRP